jgi:hypothetical protein
MLLGLHGLVSPGDSVQCRLALTYRVEMPRAKIAGIAFLVRSSDKRQKMRKKMEMRSMLGGGVGADACDIDRRTGRQAYELIGPSINQSINQASHRCPVSPTELAVCSLLIWAVWASFVTGHIGPAVRLQRAMSVARRLFPKTGCSEKK